MCHGFMSVKETVSVSITHGMGPAFVDISRHVL